MIKLSTSVLPNARSAYERSLELRAAIRTFKFVYTTSSFAKYLSNDHTRDKSVAVLDTSRQCSRSLYVCLRPKFSRKSPIVDKVQQDGLSIKQATSTPSPTLERQHRSLSARRSDLLPLLSPGKFQAGLGFRTTKKLGSRQPAITWTIVYGDTLNWSGMSTGKQSFSLPRKHTMSERRHAILSADWW